MKKVLLASIASIATIGSSCAMAQAEGDWMMRVRAVKIDTANNSDPIAAAAIPTNGIRVSDKTIPEVDFTYFLNKNFAAELVLTYPQKHDVNISASAAGAFKAGNFKHLPPTLTLQYHFLPDGQFRPYIGAGINYTRLSGVNLSPLNAVTQTLAGGNTGTNRLDKNSVGGALQIGFDIKVGAKSFLNVDIKKVYLQTDLSNSLLGKLSTVKVDPLLIGVGYGVRF
jgi:outer membrane protein